MFCGNKEGAHVTVHLQVKGVAKECLPVEYKNFKQIMTLSQNVNNRDTQINQRSTRKLCHF